MPLAGKTYFLLYAIPLKISWRFGHKSDKTGVINDPLGQPTFPAVSDCRLILDTLCENSKHYRPVLTTIIYFTITHLSRLLKLRTWKKVREERPEISRHILLSSCSSSFNLFSLKSWWKTKLANFLLGTPVLGKQKAQILPLRNSPFAQCNFSWVFKNAEGWF